MSREEFDRLPEGPPFYDYVNGEAIEVNRPTGRHQQVLLRLGNALWEHTAEQDLGEVYPDIDVRLPNGNEYGPDLVFLRKEHAERYDEATGDLYGAPDLAVEILSASTATYDRGEKLQDFHRAEVEWVWFVDPERTTFEELRWTASGYEVTRTTVPGELFRPAVFPGLEIDLAGLLKPARGGR